MNTRDMSDKELIETIKGLHESICVADCYSTRDLVNYELGIGELIDRGYVVDLWVGEIHKAEDNDNE